MPKVSVIIPSYNRAHLISETIQSVLAQTFRDYEIIVIDDGSTDNTCDIVSAFPVRYFRQDNRGVSSALNKGIEIARGEYITFLGSDDVLLEIALEKGTQILNSNSEVGFSFGQAYLMDERGHVFGLIKSSFLRRSSIVDGKEIIREMLTTYRVPITTTMARRRCLDTVGGFDESMKMAEDRAFHVNMAKLYPVAYIAEPLIKYRIHSDSISAAARFKEMEKCNSIVLERIFNDDELGPLFRRQRRNAYFQLYFRLAGHAYFNAKMKTARSYIFRAVRTYPRESLRDLGISCTFLFAKTLLPLPILAFYRRGTQYLKIAINHRLRFVKS